MRKIAIIGCGGINSWVAGHLFDLLKTYSFDEDVYVKLFDNDIVEEKNILRQNQNFDVENIMQNKAEVLATRYKFDFEPSFITEENLSNLEIFDDLLVGVDNHKTRQMLYKFALDRHKNLIDLRAQGTQISFIVIRNWEKKDIDYYNKKYFFDLNVMERKGSCQMQTDIANDHIENGNKIIAFFGIYGIYLKLLRGEELTTDEWHFAY